MCVDFVHDVISCLGAGQGPDQDGKRSSGHHESGKAKQSAWKPKTDENHERIGDREIEEDEAGYQYIVRYKVTWQ